MNFEKFAYWGESGTKKRYYLAVIALFVTLKFWGLDNIGIWGLPNQIFTIGKLLLIALDWGIIILLVKKIM